MNKIIDSIDQIESMLKDSEISGYPINLFPYGEPQLGKRDLYPSINSSETIKDSTDKKIKDGRKFLHNILTILSLADGKHSLLDIASKLDSNIDELKPVIETLENKGLIAYNREFKK